MGESSSDGEQKTKLENDQQNISPNRNVQESRDNKSTEAKSDFEPLVEELFITYNIPADWQPRSEKPDEVKLETDESRALRSTSYSDIRKQCATKFTVPLDVMSPVWYS